MTEANIYNMLLWKSENPWPHPVRAHAHTHTCTHTQGRVNVAYDSAHSEQHHHTVALLPNQAYNQHSSKGKKKGRKGINTPEEHWTSVIIAALGEKHWQKHTRESLTYLLLACVCLIWEPPLTTRDLFLSGLGWQSRMWARRALENLCHIVEGTS